MSISTPHTYIYMYINAKQSIKSNEIKSTQSNRSNQYKNHQVNPQSTIHNTVKQVKKRHTQTHANTHKHTQNINPNKIEFLSFLSPFPFQPTALNPSQSNLKTIQINPMQFHPNPHPIPNPIHKIESQKYAPFAMPIQGSVCIYQ